MRCAAPRIRSFSRSPAAPVKYVWTPAPIARQEALTAGAARHADPRLVQEPRRLRQGRQGYRIAEFPGAPAPTHAAGAAALQDAPGATRTNAGVLQSLLLAPGEGHRESVPAQPASSAARQPRTVATPQLAALRLPGTHVEPVCPTTACVPGPADVSRLGRVNSRERPAPSGIPFPASGPPQLRRFCTRGSVAAIQPVLPLL